MQESEAYDGQAGKKRSMAGVVSVGLARAMGWARSGEGLVLRAEGLTTERVVVERTVKNIADEVTFLHLHARRLGAPSSS
jgi:hypothetical protein